MKSLAVALAASLAFLISAALAGPIDEAKALFQRYVSLERAFDPAVADLYADDARIKNKRTYPTGQVRELSMPAPQYKTIIRQTMPLAKAKGDTSTYSDVTFTEEGGGVRIHATRFSDLKKYSSPISLLLAPDSAGHWQVKEELSESQP